MSKGFVVNAGCCVLVSLNGKQQEMCREGTVLPPGYAKSSVIESHIKTRHVIPLDSRSAFQRANDNPLPPGAENIIAARFVDEGEKKATKISIKPEPKTPETPQLPKPQKATAPAKKTAGKKQVEQQQSPWDVDPESLKGKSLDELTCMAIDLSQEDGKDIPEGGFASEEEAIKFLSRNFKG